MASARPNMEAGEADPAAEVRFRAKSQAALMLVESMVLALIEREILSKDDIARAIDGVVATKKALAADGTTPDVEVVAAGLLVEIGNSIMAFSPSSAPRDLAPGESGSA